MRRRRFWEQLCDWDAENFLVKERRPERDAPLSFVLLENAVIRYAKA